MEGELIKVFFDWRVMTVMIGAVEKRIASLDPAASPGDSTTLNSIFDVHVLHVGLLGDLSFIERERATSSFRDDTRYWQSVRIDTMQLYSKLRHDLIDSCSDPTFIHTLLSTGRLYSLVQHDFVAPIQERYPGCLALFPARKE